MSGHLWWIPMELTDACNVVPLPEAAVIHLWWGRDRKKPVQSQTLPSPDLIAFSQELPVPADLGGIILFGSCLRDESM